MCRWGRGAESTVWKAKLLRDAVTSARIRGRRVRHAVKEIRYQRPPASPQAPRDIVTDEDKSKPRECVEDRRSVEPLQQSLHRLTRHWALVPVCLREAFLDGTRRVLSDEAIVQPRPTHDAAYPERALAHACFASSTRMRVSFVRLKVSTPPAVV